VVNISRGPGCIRQQRVRGNTAIWRGCIGQPPPLRFLRIAPGASTSAYRRKIQHGFRRCLSKLVYQCIRNRAVSRACFRIVTHIFSLDRGVRCWRREPPARRLHFETNGATSSLEGRVQFGISFPDSLRPFDSEKGRPFRPLLSDRLTTLGCFTRAPYFASRTKRVTAVLSWRSFSRST